jgi:hypothetical protein
MSKPFIAPDLTQRPPRSPRIRLGGFVILPRALDKGRALVAGKNGEYNYACGLDRRLLEFVNVTSDALLEQIKLEKGDGEILAWIKENAGHKPAGWEILQWSAFQEARAADSVAAKERVAKSVATLAPDRTDILTGFDLLDLDDHITFGGKA